MRGDARPAGEALVTRAPLIAYMLSLADEETTRLHGNSMPHYRID